MARQWQLQAKGFVLRYEAGGYECWGFVQHDGYRWIGRYAIQHQSGPAAGFVEPSSSCFPQDSAADAMREIERLLEEGCEKLKGSPC